MPPRMFSTKDACQYISDQLKERGITYAPSSALNRIRDLREIEPVKINQQIFVYTQESLDAWIENFAAKPRGRGRPVGWRKYPQKPEKKRKD